MRRAGSRHPILRRRIVRVDRESVAGGRDVAAPRPAAAVGGGDAARHPPAAGAGAARAGGELRGHQRGRRLGRRDAVVLGVEPPPGVAAGALLSAARHRVERVGVLVRRRPVGHLAAAAPRDAGGRAADARPVAARLRRGAPALRLPFGLCDLLRQRAAQPRLLRNRRGVRRRRRGVRGSDRRHLLPLPADLRAGAAAAAAGLWQCAGLRKAGAEAVQRVRLAPPRAHLRHLAFSALRLPRPRDAAALIPRGRAAAPRRSGRAVVDGGARLHRCRRAGCRATRVAQALVRLLQLRRGGAARRRRAAALAAARPRRVLVALQECLRPTLRRALVARSMATTCCRGARSALRGRS